MNVSKKERIPSGGENRVIDLPCFHLKRPLVYIKYGGSYNDIFPKLAVHLYQYYKQIVQHVIGWNDHIGKVEKMFLSSDFLWHFLHKGQLFVSFIPPKLCNEWCPIIQMRNHGKNHLTGPTEVETEFWLTESVSIIAVALSPKHTDLTVTHTVCFLWFLVCIIVCKKTSIDYQCGCEEILQSSLAL